MVTAIDTNILVALWDLDDSLNQVAQRSLDEAQNRGALVISAPVFAELLAFPARNAVFVDTFLNETGIAVEWNLDEGIWRLAAEAFQKYASRRRKQGESGGPRRILADFLIGAHAQKRGYRLLTLDEGLYPTAFPRLILCSV
jgi:predicted nucleic acid-binding protein